MKIWILWAALTLLIGCKSSLVEGGPIAHQPSPMISLEEAKYECLKTPVHETLVLEPQTTRRIRGKVLHRDESLHGVKLFLEVSEGNGKGAFVEETNVHGSFEFRGIADGSYKLSTCFNGWNVTLIEVRLDRNASDSELILPLTIS